MRLFTFSPTPATTERISINASIADRVMVSTALVYFLLFLFVLPKYALICAIAFLLVTELLGSIMQTLFTLSEQVRLSSLVGPAVSEVLSSQLEKDDKLKKLSDIMDFDLDPASMIGSGYWTDQLKLLNIVKSERRFDFLGFFLVLVLPSVLGLCGQVYFSST